MAKVKIEVDLDEVLREVCIEDFITFHTPKAIIGYLTGREIVEHWDNDDLLDELDNDKIIEYANNILAAGD
jgi:hypothetical protein